METAVLPGPLVSPAWLAARLGPPVVVLDATVILPAPQHDGDYRPQTARPRFEAGHIPTARYADLLGELSNGAASYHFARPDAGEFAAAISRLGITDSSIVVSYDSEGGLWAARLWWMLRWIGVHAAVLDGGYAAWLAFGGAIDSGQETTGQTHSAGPHSDGHPRSGTGSAGVTPRQRQGMWADLTDVAEIAAGDRAGSLVCALSADMFAGISPTRYARRGHIPGSQNIPARGLLTPAGQLRPLEELERALGSLPDDGPVTVYCGGGISAAVVAQALTILGREDVAIYDGSLEEWAADPDLPLELGAGSDNNYKSYS